MTLVFTKQGKPDNRMVEYDQAVVRLGLEKAELESEVEKKKKEIKELGVAHELIRSTFQEARKKLTTEKQEEIDEKISIFSDYEIKIAGAKKILNETVILEKESEERINVNNQQCRLLGDKLESIKNKKEILSEELDKLTEVRLNKERELHTATLLFREQERNKERLASLLYKMAMQNKDIISELELKYKELAELNDIISVLKSSNQEGLDLVSSFEGERKRLKTREEFLLRKEADLAVYENRLKKHCEKAGYNVEMIFK